MKKVILYIIILISFNCCSVDYVEDLPNNFQFVSESNINTFIVGDNITIPCQVRKYTYDKKFIISTQFYYSPTKCLERGDYYNQTEGKLYYWIIDIKKDKLVGPFEDYESFNKKKKELGVDLDF